MVIPIDCVDLEDFQLMEKGLPPRPKPEVVYVEPTPPVVRDQVKFEDIPDRPIRDLEARRRNYQNIDGMTFTGYNFCLTFEGGESISGWLPEGEFQKLKKRVPPERSDLIQKVGW